MFKRIIEKHKKRKAKEFAAKLKYGKYWHQELYPHLYTSSGGAE